MDSINFFALGILFLYSCAYMLIVRRIDKYLRKKNNPHRKSIVITIGIVQMLFMWVASFFYEEYMPYLVAPSLSFPMFSYNIIRYEK